MKFSKGKKVVFLGDSITEGVGASRPENCFVRVFAGLSGAEVFNYGIGGTRIAKQKTPSENPQIDSYFASRVEGMIEGADYAFVFGGTNDFGHGDAPLGKFGDKTADTFYGGLYELYAKLCGKYPAARIVAITPLHRLSENEPYNENQVKRTAMLSDYVNAVREVAQKFSLPVLDLYANANIQPQIEQIRGLYMPDGLHPSDLGHRRIAEMLCRFIQTI